MSRKQKKDVIHYLPLLGCVATGITYAGIGTIALLSFFKVREGGADESSMLVVLNDFIAGTIIIWIILLGTACYIAWRLYETLTDPYDYGKQLKGVMRRAGIALSTVPDMLIVYAGIRVLLGIGDIQGDGQPVEERAMVAGMMDGGKGWLIITAGCVILGTAVIQVIYGITKGYKERVNEKYFNPGTEKWFTVLGWVGYVARGIILGITGYFFIAAGISGDADVVVNTDKAFDFIGDHIGHFVFIIVALGTISYGLFMFALGITYKSR